jgi:hypothetical protein
MRGEKKKMSSYWIDVAGKAIVAIGFVFCGIGVLYNVTKLFIALVLEAVEGTEEEPCHDDEKKDIFAGSR